MKSKDADALEAIRLRGHKPWTLEIPISIPDRDAAVRKGTREVDHPILEDDRRFGLLLTGVCLIGLSALGGLAYGYFDWIYFLFK